MSFNTWYGEGIELARSRFSIIPADAKASISATQAAVNTGGEIAVAWPGARSSMLYEELASGDYEVRQMHDDHCATLAVAAFTINP